MPTKRFKPPSTARKSSPRKARKAKGSASRSQRPAAGAPAGAVVSRKAIKRTYHFAVGRRKTAIARVRYTEGGGEEITVNGRPVSTYFPFLLQKYVREPLVLVAREGQGVFSIRVAGGGLHSQAEAIRHGVARILASIDDGMRATLKSAGLLTRDARVKERKKYGLRRARRAPQWQKR